MPSTVDSGHLKAYLHSYLGGISPGLIRSYVITSFIIPVLFISFGSFVPPLLPFMVYFLIGGIAAFLLWGIWIATAPYRAQRIIFLYLGLFNAYSSVGLVIVSIKLIYFTMNVRETWYPCFIVTGYLILAYLLWRVHVKTLYSGVYFNGRTNKAKKFKQAGFVGLGIGVGMVGSQFFLAQNPSYDVSMAVLACLLLMLAFILLLTVNTVHKYVLMGRYPELVRYIEKPSIPKKEYTKSRRRTQ
ncbi:hypothetical protein [Cohnella candidum]|nr:hypothetical protein [Cohnella candidum]